MVGGGLRDEEKEIIGVSNSKFATVKRKFRDSSWHPFCVVSTYVVQLEIEAAGIAHGLTVGVAPPQGCCARVAVGTKCARPLADDL